MWLWLGVFGFILLAIIVFVYRYLDRRAESKFHPHAPKQLLVKFKEGTTEDEMHTLHKKGRCKVAETYEDLGWYRVESRKKMHRMLVHDVGYYKCVNLKNPCKSRVFILCILANLSQ
ncbi:hypothetical protein [Paenibacillus amylolyticus]|uniref:hypothetical protein n=1 Tax=Paenibacillus amylolyticus TaxID=1451 RepID=UPI003D999E42